MEQNEGVGAQNALVAWFYKKQRVKPFDIEFQDVQATNAILSKAGIDIHNLSNYTPQELAQLLGVDAVMGGSMQTDKPLSEGATVAIGVAFGVWGPTNSGNVTINLSNAADGALLWKYDKQLARGLGSDMTVLMDTLMRKASKKFPTCTWINLVTRQSDPDRFTSRFAPTGPMRYIALRARGIKAAVFLPADELRHCQFVADQF